MSRRSAPLLFLIALAAHAAAGDPAVPVRTPGLRFRGNLLPQGDFENPNASTGRAERFCIPNNQTVTPHGRAPVPLAEAALPPGVKVPGGWLVHPIRPSSIVMTRASIIASGVLVRSMLAGCPGGPSTA
jgi:hypothetical protein